MHASKLLLLSLLLVLAGCDWLPPHGEDPDHVVRLGEPFELPLDGRAAVLGTTLRLTFEAVLEDSRCPERATCIWPGVAWVHLGLAQHGAPRDTTLLSIPGLVPTPYHGNAWVAAGGYRLKLLRLTPTPPHPPGGVPPYRALLLVERTG